MKPKWIFSIYVSWLIAFGIGAVRDWKALRDFDRVVLDLLAPWEHVAAAADWLIPGGLLCSYVATTTQLSRVVEELRGHGNFDEPASWESMMRSWHVEGLAVRPDHRMVGHTGFLVTARRLADGVTAPPRRRRPAKGAQDTTDYNDISGITASDSSISAPNLAAQRQISNDAVARLDG